MSHLGVGPTYLSHDLLPSVVRGLTTDGTAMSCGDAPAALPPAAVEGVLVSFTGPDDDEVEGGALRQLSQVRFEGVAPVRRFGSFKGQRNFTGSWWFATTGRHVGFESWVERDQVMLLDFDWDDPTINAVRYPQVIGADPDPRDPGRSPGRPPDHG